MQYTHEHKQAVGTNLPLENTNRIQDRWFTQPHKSRWGNQCGTWLQTQQRAEGIQCVHGYCTHCASLHWTPDASPEIVWTSVLACYMPQESVASGKSFPACSTFEGPVSCVCLFVGIQIRFAVELPFAESTLVRAIPSVNSLVNREIAARRQCLSTIFASKVVLRKPSKIFCLTKRWFRCRNNVPPILVRSEYWKQLRRTVHYGLCYLWGDFVVRV
mmetsp:Transcript_16177/g.31608  ORF Transcript_16177/g.31608 Transcript_16177/m.31608 type:complete len:216 (+) Transcript_16177:156-803(+)